MSGWISVKDMLPGTRVKKILCHTEKDVFVGQFSGGDFWDGFDTHKGQGIRDVTHWMPLPEPPTSENK